MQKQAGDFLVKRTVSLYGPGGVTVELYELPNGQWQFGKGREATVVTSLEQVSMLDAGTQRDVAAWLERTKHQPTPQAQYAGSSPMLAGDTARDQLGRAIAQMSDEVVARLLDAVVKTVGPVADSITQGLEANSHGDGYAPSIHAERPAFQLPPGARWADPNNHAAGFLTPLGTLDEKGVPMTTWHRSPEFDAAINQPDPVPIADMTPLHVHDPATDAETEIAQARQSHGAQDLVGAGRSARRRK